MEEQRDQELERDQEHEDVEERRAGEPAGRDQELERDQDTEDMEERRAGEPAGEAAGWRADSPEVRAATAVATAPDVEPTTAAGAGTPTAGAERSDLLGDGELTSLRDRWAGLQSMFVDDPGRATREADTMVGDLLDHLRSRHQELHDGGREANGDTDTEALRVEFLRYRSFLRVLLG